MSYRRFLRLRTIVLVAILATFGPIARPLSAQQPGKYGHYTVEDPDLPTREEYAARRQRVMALLDEGSALLVRSADVRNRSNDVDYDYRQRNSLLYLSGVTEEGSALLLVPSGIDVNGSSKATEILFVSKRNPAMETWTGITMGPAVAASVSGIATVVPYDQLENLLDRLLPQLSTLYYDGWLHGKDQEPLTGTSIDWPAMMGQDLESRYPGLSVQNVSTILSGLRLVKSKTEMALLRRAIDISVVGHEETIRSARPGMYEYELQAIMEYAFKRQGAEYPGYPSIVGSGPNSCILHYIANRRKTEPGDLVLMDCGAEYHGYSADVTRTIPISGRFTPEQLAIYDLVLAAQNAGIDECRAGNAFFMPGKMAMEVIADGLQKLGITHTSAEARKYFMHGTSHYIGLDVHDVGAMKALGPGMVLTVEPGIYIPVGSDCDPKWWNIGVRIEDDIAVTEGDPINLSGKLARSAEDIERLMGQQSQ